MNNQYPTSKTLGNMPEVARLQP